eukprot:15271383-Alexandrium_andersonii.AAC.1
MHASVRAPAPAARSVGARSFGDFWPRTASEVTGSQGEVGAAAAAATAGGAGDDGSLLLSAAPLPCVAA